MAELERSSTRLRRIFEEIDLAAAPASTTVREALVRWERLRAGQTAPTLRPAGTPGSGHLLPQELIAVTDSTGRQWHVREAGDAVRALLGLGPEAGELAESSQRRMAMQLRLLLQEAVRRGEPLVALSACRTSKGQRLQLEMLAAPLDSGNRHAPAALAALAARSEGQNWGD